MTTRPPSDPDSWYDPDKEALAEIARLTAINADLRAVNLSHAEAAVSIAGLEAKLRQSGQELASVVNDKTRLEARIAELEAALAQVRNDNPVLSRIAELEAQVHQRALQMARQAERIAELKAANERLRKALCDNLSAQTGVLAGAKTP